jgi:hypothetical protein
MGCVAKLDEEYIARMEDVLKIYENPLAEREPVVCVDEKPVVLPTTPLRQGRVARRDYEYLRCGTANVFCAIEPKAGVHFTKVTPRARRLNSPISCWRLPSIAPPPIPSIWCWTT